jgi:hypothetical protein
VRQSDDDDNNNNNNNNNNNRFETQIKHEKDRKLRGKERELKIGMKCKL